MVSMIKVHSALTDLETIVVMDYINRAKSSARIRYFFVVKNGDLMSWTVEN